MLGLIDWNKGEHGGKRTFKVFQQDGARPHTGDDNISDLEKAGKGEGWEIKVVTQPVQSPEFNINHLGFFQSLKTKVMEENCHVPKRGEMINLVRRSTKSMIPRS